MPRRFTVFRDPDAWIKLGPFGGWVWASTADSPRSVRESRTPWGAWLAGRRATRHDMKEQR
jgi:hypothetical protein